jgi:hypothetical protein
LAEPRALETRSRLHPDRFASSPGLKADAVEKLKRLNAAIETLQAHLSVSADDAVDTSGQLNVDSSYRASVFYRGSDPRIHDVTMSERVKGGSVAVVELSKAGICLRRQRSGDRTAGSVIFDIVLGANHLCFRHWA